MKTESPLRLETDAGMWYHIGELTISLKPQSDKENDKMTKVTKRARFGRGRKLVALLVVGIAVGAYADGATSRIRHMADTYLQSDGTQIIDTGFIASTNMRVEVVFMPLENQYTTYTRYVWGSNASSTPASLRCICRGAG